MQGTGFFSNSLDERDKRPGIIVKKLVTDVSLFKIIPRPEVRQHVAFTMSWKLTGAGSCDLATHAHGCQASGGLFPPGLTFPGINLSVPYLVSLCSARMFQKLSVLWTRLLRRFELSSQLLPSLPSTCVTPLASYSPRSQCADIYRIR